MKQYAFGDKHKDKKFKIYIDFQGAHVEAELVIEGLEPIKYPGKSWKDKESAVEHVREDARRRIEDIPA